MNKLKIKKYNDSLLNNATLITKGKGFFKTYDLNNGNIIKVVKSVESCMDQENGMYLYSLYDDFLMELYGKLKRSECIEEPSIVLPNAVYMGDMFPKAYTVPKQTGYLDLDIYLTNSDLELIASTVIRMCEIVRNANKDGIVMPDLGNPSNVLINPITHEFRFIDYDGMQIDKFQSFNLSALLHNDILGLADNKRFFNRSSQLFDPIIDKYSLIAIFLYYTTNTYVADFKPSDYIYKNGEPKLKESAIHDYARMIGIEDTPLEQDLYDIHFSSRANYPETSIKKLLKTHKLVKEENKRFIKI